MSEAGEPAAAADDTTHIAIDRLLADGPPGFDALIGLWRETFETSVRDLSVSPEWTLRAAQSAGLGERLRMLGIRRGDGRLLAFGAFIDVQERIYGIQLRVREMPGNRLVVYHNEFVGEHGDALLERMFSTGQTKCDLICVPAVPKDSQTDQAVQKAAARHRWTMIRIPGYRSPYIPIEGSWDDYLARKSSNFRYTLRRKQRALENLGRTSEKWYECVESVDELLNCIAQIEVSSWKVDASMAITGSAQETAYYRALLPWLAGKGALRANVISVNETPAAYSLCYVWRGRVAQMKTSFDERFSGASPGLVVNASAIRRAFESGALEFDFLGDVMPHKMHWASDIRAHDHLFVYTSTMRGRLVGSLKQLNYRLRPYATYVTAGRGAHRDGTPQE